MSFISNDVEVQKENGRDRLGKFNVLRQNQMVEENRRYEHRIEEKYEWWYILESRDMKM